MHEQSNFWAKTEKGKQYFAEQRGIRIVFLDLAIRNPLHFSQGFGVLLQGQFPEAILNISSLSCNIHGWKTWAIFKSSRIMQTGTTVRTRTDLPPSLHIYFFRVLLLGKISDYLPLEEISQEKILCILACMKFYQEKTDRKWLLIQKKIPIFK